MIAWSFTTVVDDTCATGRAPKGIYRVVPDYERLAWVATYTDRETDVADVIGDGPTSVAVMEMCVEHEKGAK